MIWESFGAIMELCFFFSNLPFPILSACRVLFDVTTGICVAKGQLLYCHNSMHGEVTLGFFFSFPKETKCYKRSETKKEEENEAR
jgi:hypothetical protein